MNIPNLIHQLNKTFLNNYLHFLIDTQLKYANIKAITRQYQVQIIKYYNQFNLNLHIINKKRRKFETTI